MTGVAAQLGDLLVVQNLCVQLPTFRLNGISFSLEPGKITALLGHNGAGKTTTLHLIVGLMRADSGRVSVGGITTADEIEYRNRIGFVPDEPHFYSNFTVRELIAFAAPFYKSWDANLCEALLSSLDLEPGKLVGSLSRGTRTKLSLLLAFCHNPDVLLLDEPTAALDPRSRVRALDLMRRAAGDGRGVLFSTHNLLEVEEVADRVIVLDHGRVLANETLAKARSHLSAAAEWSLESYYFGLVK